MFRKKKIKTINDKTITIREFLELILKHQAYCYGKDMRPSQVNRDLNSSSEEWQVESHTFSGRDGEDFYSKYRILQKKAPNFANCCSIYCQQNLMMPIEGFIQHVSMVLWPEYFKHFSESSLTCRILSNDRASIKHRLILKESDHLLHHLTLGISEISSDERGNKKQEKVDISPWKIIFSLTFDDELQKFRKVIIIKQWPVFKDNALQKTIGNANTRITKEQAQNVLAVIAPSHSEMLKELNELFTGRSCSTIVGFKVPNEKEFTQLVKDDPNLSPDDKINFLLRFKCNEASLGQLCNPNIFINLQLETISKLLKDTRFKHLDKLLANRLCQFLIDPKKTESFKVANLRRYLTDNVFLEKIINKHMLKSEAYKLEKIYMVMLYLANINHCTTNNHDDPHILDTLVLLTNDLSSSAKIEKPHRDHFIQFIFKKFTQHPALINSFFRKEHDTKEYLTKELKKAVDLNQFAKENNLQNLFFS